MRSIGRTSWVIAEGHIPDGSTGPQPQMLPHETARLLNRGDVDAHVEITVFVFFGDRDPAGPSRATVPARRAPQQRFDGLTDPEPVPVDTDHASVMDSDVPIVVQHTRLDSRQAENAPMTTAFAA